jgi:uncharacterized delta-60 repeat protein
LRSLPAREGSEMAMSRKSMRTLSAVGRLAIGMAGALLVLQLHLSSHAQAAAGDLDPTFGSGGEVVTDFGTLSDQAQAVAIQPDGKIVAAGTAPSEGGDFALARYNTDGTLDTSFGSGGKVATDFGLWEGGHAVALQADGKVVVAGFTGVSDIWGDFALARYNPDGTLDPTFGSAGKVVTDFGSAEDVARAVAVQPDGRIVAVGWSHVDFALARYNTDGTLDPTFGTGGRVLTDFHDMGSDDRAYAMALQPDGKIIAAGSANGGSSGEGFGLARYNPDGSLDSGFAFEGELIFFFGAINVARAVALQPDGKIVAAGGNDDFLLLRVTPDGRLDTSFGTDGAVATDFGGQDFATAVALQQDGKIVSAGASFLTNFDSRFALARYLAGETAPACTVTGTPGADVLRGGNGDDVICGLGGSDRLFGGTGNDILRGGPGDDMLLGGEGDDAIVGGPGGDRLIGGPGDDVLVGVDGVSGNDRLRGGDGSDTCTADPGDRVAGCP